MDSIIELQRQTHEEIERYERALYTILSRPQNAHQSRLQNEHKASQIIDRISSRATTLNSTYQDQDVRSAEIDAISTPSQPGDLSEFYARLGKIQEHHNKYPDAGADGPEFEIAALLDEFNPDDYDDDEEYVYEDPVANMFSGEEVYGKYLDVHANHTTYNNLKNIGRHIGYLQYLDALLLAENGLIHTDIPKETRLSRDYEKYIHALHTYLTSFMRRTQPLVDVDSKQTNVMEEFEKKWEAGELEGWADASQKARVDGSGDGIWCTACQKMYSKQTVYDAHLTSKKHIKATSKQATSDQPPSNPNGPPSAPTPSANVESSKNKHRTAALFTYLATALIADLLPILNDTKANVERRFSLTAKEREQEILEAQKPPAPPPTAGPDGGAEEEEEEERIYNPLKLPMGWDGKPIPYWLYKLHGLGVEYRCEICSDHVYMGRKNFERHFQESRHAFGMRALGLPNTKHFHEITKIEDAMALAERLKREGRHEIFDQETMEELEDEEGNVYNRKTYDDLKKQGLI
ncbi:RNA splicing factor PRP9 [Russula dissimulans]|nr:RNA splicing factor PRP9 [Russula dissimulans]